MTNKLPTLAGYMTIGAVLIWLLAANLLKRDVGQERKAPVPLPLIVFSIEALVFLSFAKPRLGVGSIGVVLLSAVACYASAGQSRWKSDWPVLASLVVTLLFATTLAWWRRTGPELDASYGAFIALHVLLAISFWILARAPEEGRRSDRIEPLAVIVFIGFGAFVVFSTGLYDNPWMYGLAWHHWGAYVGPAQLVSAGARILHDIPAQYGFGPTMLLALSCKEDCWLAMYWWVAVLSLTYGALILWTARKASAGQQAPLQIVLIAFAVFATVYRKRSVKHVLPANLTYRFFSKRTLPSLQGSRAS